MSNERRRGDPSRPKEVTILELGNITLFGVNHRNKLPKGFRLQQIRGYFKEADHLLIEGSKPTIGLRNMRNPQNYEDLAVSVFKSKKSQENVHCLEEDVDLRSISSSYGIDPEVVMAYSLQVPISDVLEKITQHKLHSSKIFKYVDEVSTVYKSRVLMASTLTEKDIAGSIRRNVVGAMVEQIKADDVQGLQRSFEAAFFVVQEYLARVRDYEWIGPRVAELLDTLPGKKVIVVGKNHLPAMEAVLCRQPVSKPVSWGEYKETLDPEKQKQVELFERVARGGIAA